MALFNPTPHVPQLDDEKWANEIYQLQTTDKGLGGEGGALNLPLAQLTARTSYLKKALTTHASGDDPHGDREYTDEQIAAHLGRLRGVVSAAADLTLTAAHVGKVIYTWDQATEITLPDPEPLAAGAAFQIHNLAVAAGLSLVAPADVSLSADGTSVSTLTVPAQAWATVYRVSATRWHVHLAGVGGGAGAHTVGESYLVWDRDTPPAKTLERNGVILNRDLYADLWAWGQEHAVVLSDADWLARAAAPPYFVGQWSSGDATTTFRIPRDSGAFLRIVSHGLGSDPDRASRIGGDRVGSTQINEFKEHDHNPLYLGNGSYGSGHGGGDRASTYGAHGYTAVTGGAETRSDNLAVLSVITYE